MTTTKIYYFYIVCCIDNTLYSGITTDLDRRIREHNTSKRGAKYTGKRRPVKLVHFEKFAGRSAAMKREWLVKHMSKEKKEILIEKNSSLYSTP